MFFPRDLIYQAVSVVCRRRAAVRVRAAVRCQRAASAAQCARAVLGLIAAQPYLVALSYVEFGVGLVEAFAQVEQLSQGHKGGPVGYRTRVHQVAESHGA